MEASKKAIKLKKMIREGYKILNEEDYSELSVETLIKRLKTYKNVFYEFFGNKEEFVLAVMDYYFSTMQQVVDYTLYNHRLTPKQRIMKLYSDYIDKLANKEISKIGKFTTEMLLISKHNTPAMKEKILQYNDHVLNSLNDCLYFAKKFGDIEKCNDTEKMAILIVNSWQGAVFNVNATGNIKSLFTFREILRDFMLK